MKKNETFEAAERRNFMMLEALGYFTLNGNEEQQVNLAEQIAAQRYEYIDDLVQVVEGYAPKKTFKKELKELKESKGFDGYWRKDAVTKAVIENMKNSNKEDCI